MGWNRPSGASVPTEKKSQNGVKVALVLLILVAICTGAFIILSHKPEEKIATSSRSTNKQIKSVQPSKAKVEPEKKKEDVVYKLPDGRPSIPLRKMSREQRIAWLTQARIEDAIANGRTNANGEAILVTSQYRSVTEEALAQIFSIEPGMPPPPFMPRIPDSDRKNMADILAFMSESKPDDSPETKEMREIVGQAKRMLAEYIGDGGDPDSFIDYYRGQLEHFSQLRADADKTFKQLFAANEDPVVIKEYYQSANKVLEEKGIKPLSLTRRMKEILGMPTEE